MQVVGTRISQLLRTAHAELSRLCATSVARQADGGHVGELSKFIMPNSAARQLQYVVLKYRTETPTLGINCSLVALTRHEATTWLARKTKNSESTTSKEAVYSQQFLGKARRFWSSATLARRVAFEYSPHRQDYRPDFYFLAINQSATKKPCACARLGLPRRVAHTSYYELFGEGAKSPNPAIWR